MQYFIGIDLGTSSVKGILTDERGQVLRESGAEYRLLAPAPGWKEIDPETWWEATCRTLTGLLEEKNGGSDGGAGEARGENSPGGSMAAEAGEGASEDMGLRTGKSAGKGAVNLIASRVAGIGITGQMHTVVMLDADGSSIRPALMWNDVRTRDLIAGLKARIRETDVDYIANIISTGSPAANLYWLRENEPDNFRRLKKFLIGPDYLVYRFTGEYGTDYCEASTSSLYDIKNHCWSETMMEIVGLSEEVYPMVRGSACVVGNVTAELKERFGFGPDVKVIAGTGDNPAASIPTGCLGSGYPVFSLGTSGVLMHPRKQPDFSAKGKNILFSFDDERFYTLVQGVVQSCGSTYNWWIREILAREDFGKADSGISPEHLGESELMFYPHLVGDKTIYADPTLRGAFIGLSTDTTSDEMTQAVMEGIAFGLKQLTEEMHVDKESLSRLKAIGGGSRSRVWMQIIADVLDSPVEQLEGNAGAGYGMALLAAYSCKAIDSLEDIAGRAVTVKERFLPREYNAGLYRKKYRRYLRMHDALKMVEEE